MRTKCSVLRLVQQSVSKDTVAFFEHCLAEARAGRIIGAAAVLMHKTNDWTLDAAGECKRHPELTRGHVAALDDELADLPRHA